MIQEIVEDVRSVVDWLVASDWLVAFGRMECLDFWIQVILCFDIDFAEDLEFRAEHAGKNCCY